MDISTAHDRYQKYQDNINQDPYYKIAQEKALRDAYIPDTLKHLFMKKNKKLSVLEQHRNVLVKKYMKNNADDAFETGYVDGFDTAIALDLPIKFMNWTLEGDCTHTPTDEDEWTPIEYSSENRLPSLTTRELYDLWIENFYNPE